MIVLVFKFLASFFQKITSQPNKNNKFFQKKWIKDMKKSGLRSSGLKLQ
ncbi:hypothetical protein JCM19300_132 [Algibacter lectus]|uniref:Uncharacterized protein n=1 Tax=Algibacter lectus TaxID=221126 RepID=A0A090VII4_9FLAO|nr:hypothetical protein JCM19300_132 [Algibacter lectus]